MRLILQPFLTIAFWSRRRTSRELIPPWCEHPTVSWCSLALKSLMLGKWWQNCKDAQNSSIAELDMRIWKDTLDADDWWLMIADWWLVIGGDDDDDDHHDHHHPHCDRVISTIIGEWKIKLFHWHSTWGTSNHHHVINKNANSSSNTPQASFLKHA